jgi:hypothetical protein
MKTLKFILCILVFCACSTWGYSETAPATTKADKEAYIDCVNGVFDSLESYKEKNEVHEGFKLTWYARGKKDTVVKIDFVKKINVCKGVSPFPDASFSKTISKDYGFEKIDSGKVKTGSGESCYTYTITCTPPQPDKPIIIDPIIDVPKP